MFRYLKEYHWADMTQIMRNDRARQRSSDARMEGKTCIIRCTSGIGWEAARALADCGGSVVMVDRSREKSERALEALRTDCGTV